LDYQLNALHLVSGKRYLRQGRLLLREFEMQQQFIKWTYPLTPGLAE
jgi:hypothetical protein